jgi:hypothetical protein
MSTSKGKSIKKMEEERQARIEDLRKMVDDAGDGLLRSQVDLKYAPWHITWERQDMIMERQERMIELLEEMLKELKKKK